MKPDLKGRASKPAPEVGARDVPWAVVMLQWKPGELYQG